MTTDGRVPTRVEWIVAVAIAIGLTVVFWPGLWQGRGLIGGDTYSYFLPQKVEYARQIGEGELPLWNPLVGHGYPILGESQTGALAPVNLICYRFLAINTAYNAVQIVHYVLCFVFAWLYARRLGQSPWAALFAALVFTYAWFPFRISLEWAIVTGAWFPATMWCAESFLQTRRWRFVAGLAVVSGVQLLAGHYQLAFLTHVTLAVYVPCRLWFSKDLDGREWRVAGACLGALVLGYGLAAVQLLPSWELKQRSQRTAVGKEYQPGFGHTPAWSWSQVVAPWMWYGIETDWQARLPEGDPGTNDIEAHLYFGMIPIILVAVLLARREFDRALLWWLLLGIAALVYATGWLLPLGEHIPGFSYFRSPGRFTLITTFAIAVIAGAALHHMTRNSGRSTARFVCAGLFLLTAGDLLWVARQDPVAIVIPDPPIENVQRSQVRKILKAHSQPPRLFARGANLPTTLGVAATPVYLGLGPAEYFDEATAIPGPVPFDRPPNAKQREWLRRAGVTHVLSFAEVDDPAFRHVWSGRDTFLNRSWGRREALHLYELTGTRGRVAWHSGAGSLSVAEYGANTVRVSVDADRAGRVVLTDLAYPGWQATVDGEAVTTHTIDGMYRGVDVTAGSHEIVWRYRPWSFRIGAGISLATLLLLAGITVFQIRQMKRGSM